MYAKHAQERTCAHNHAHASCMLVVCVIRHEDKSAVYAAWIQKALYSCCIVSMSEHSKGTVWAGRTCCDNDTLKTSNVLSRQASCAQFSLRKPRSESELVTGFSFLGFILYMNTVCIEMTTLQNETVDAVLVDVCLLAKNKTIYIFYSTEDSIKFSLYQAWTESVSHTPVQPTCLWIVFLDACCLEKVTLVDSLITFGAC